MKITRYMRTALVLAGLLAAAARSTAQDTLRLTLPQAEQLFLEKNLSLLAEKYNIDMARAQVIQARLYSNPNLQLDASLWNPNNRKVMDVGNREGQYVATLQQMITLAGKRNKQIKMAETNVQIGENRLYDLLRTLRFTLHSDYYQAYFLQNSITAYQAQINSLEKLTISYTELQAKGVVTLKDVVRIKSLLYSLKAEQTGLQNQFNDTQAELQLLLQNNHTWYLPAFEFSPTALPAMQQFSLAALVDSAYTNRSDLKLAQNNLVYSQQDYALQKANAVPDLMLGAQFDKRGSYIDNATMLSVAMDLPFFNRNQGNIKAAKTAIEQSRVLVERQRQTVENEVQQAYIKALNTEKMLRSIDNNFQQDFNKLLNSITENFEKRNISLLDFTDFYDSYKQNTLQWNQLQNERLQAIENLNYTIGKTIINL